VHSSEFFQRLLRADFSLFLSFFGVKSSLFFFPYSFVLFSFSAINSGVLSAELLSEDGDAAWGSQGLG